MGQLAGMKRGFFTVRPRLPVKPLKGVEYHLLTTRCRRREREMFDTAIFSPASDLER
jgi:hypothetical protein